MVMGLPPYTRKTYLYWDGSLVMNRLRMYISEKMGFYSWRDTYQTLSRIPGKPRIPQHINASIFKFILLHENVGIFLTEICSHEYTQNEPVGSDNVPRVGSYDSLNNGVHEFARWVQITWCWYGVKISSLTLTKVIVSIFKQLKIINWWIKYILFIAL